MKKIVLPLIMILLVMMTACTAQSIPTPTEAVTPTPIDNIHATTDFEGEDHGFDVGFADYPQGEEAFYELEYEVTDIPDLNTKGIMVKGNNHSDDLLMYITKAFNVEPNTEYNISIQYDLATNVAGGMVGIGGSPGASIFVKAGVHNKAFVPQIDDAGYLRANWDIDNQGNEGPDAKVLGNIEKTESDDDSYQFKPFYAEFTVTSGDDGKIHILLFTDSGFEGLTQIYYDNIKVDIEKAQ